MIKRLLKFFGDRDLPTITTEDIQGFLTQYTAGCSNTTKKVARRLDTYIEEKGFGSSGRLFPMTYGGARAALIRTANAIGVHVRPHDLRRYAATYASRSGVPIEIVSKVILRHSNLATTQIYLGRVSDEEAFKWIEDINR